MTLRPGLYVDDNTGNGVTQPQDARLAFAGLLSGPGSVKGAAVTGSTSGPNMKYVIPADVYVTARGVAATDGLYLLANDGALTVDSGAPAPSSGSRWDLVWVRQQNAYTSDGFGDTSSTPTSGVTVGTAGSSPTKPYASVPAGALVLAESSVGANIANASLAVISQVAASVALLSGIARATAPTGYPASPVVGQYVDDATLGLQRWTGTAWQPVNLQTLRAQYRQLTTAANMPNGSYATVYPLDKEVDTIGLTNTNGVFTFPAGSGGQYKLSGRVGFAGTVPTGTLCGAQLLQNSTVLSGKVGEPATTAAKVLLDFPPLEVTIAAGDTITIQGFVGTSGQATSLVAGYQTMIRADRVA